MPLPPRERVARAYAEAAAIAEEDVAACAAIGQHGLALLQDDRDPPCAGPAAERPDALQRRLAGLRRLGHGARARLRGTRAGLPVHVYVDETRPRSQGAFLTAFELGAHGIAHTVIADNAGGHLMQQGDVDVCFVGSDRTTATRRRRQQDRHVPQGAGSARQRRAVLCRAARVDDRLVAGGRGWARADRGAFVARSHARARSHRGRRLHGRGGGRSGQPGAQPGLRRDARRDS